MALWIMNPLAVLAEDAMGGLVIDQGRIVETLNAGQKPSIPVTQKLDASRHVILPGLINTHHHYYQTLTRAFPSALNKELFDWLKALYPIWSRLDPEALELATRLVLVEMLLSGTTLSVDHHYVFPKGLENAIDIQARVAAELGMRATLTRGSMNLSVSDGGLPPDEVVQDHDTILADCARVISSHHQVGPDAMVQIALAPCSPFSVTKELMIATGEMARSHGVGLHTHLAETEDENTFCSEMFGCRPLDYLEDCGWLAPSVWLAHGMQFDEGEIHRLGKAGMGVSHCPSSNMLLSSGICRTPQLENAGVSVGLGIDRSASQDCSNMIQDVRQAFMSIRLAYGASVTHEDALRWATSGSAGAIGRPELGVIAAGRPADLALFNLDELRFSGHGDPLAALILCGAHQADHVMIAGEWIVENGQIQGLDIARLRAEHQAAARKVQGEL